MRTEKLDSAEAHHLPKQVSIWSAASLQRLSRKRLTNKTIPISWIMNTFCITLAFTLLTIAPTNWNCPKMINIMQRPVRAGQHSQAFPRAKEKRTRVFSLSNHRSERTPINLITACYRGIGSLQLTVYGTRTIALALTPWRSKYPKPPIIHGQFIKWKFKFHRFNIKPSIR